MDSLDFPMLFDFDSEASSLVVPEDPVRNFMKDELADVIARNLKEDTAEAHIVAKRILSRRKRLRDLEHEELDALDRTNKKLREMCEMHGLHWVGLDVIRHGGVLHAMRPTFPAHDLNPVDPYDALIV